MAYQNQEFKQLSAKERKELKRKRNRKPVVLPVRKLSEQAQIKAEIGDLGDKELPKEQKFALQQKYGLSGVLDTDIYWYLQEVQTRG